MGRAVASCAADFLVSITRYYSVVTVGVGLCLPKAGKHELVAICVIFRYTAGKIGKQNLCFFGSRPSDALDNHGLRGGR